MRLVLLQCVILLCSCSFAQTKKECSQAEAMEAERIAASLKSWSEVHSAFKKYSHCDDGAIAEGFSESVSQLLANKWNTLSDLQRLTRSDQGFEQFVLRHIDQTAAEENLTKIKENAKSRCPNGNAAFCKKIESALQ